METFGDLQVIAFEDDTQLEAWLAANHGLTTGVWLKIAKKASGLATVTAAEVIDVALCYGWIDGQRRGLDETYYLQKITPRRRRSEWSMVNVRKVEELTAAGRMREPGLAAVEAAKADGRWDAAYESQKNATVPPDLAAALEQNKPAADFYAGLGKTDRYFVILRLLKAKTPEHRALQLERMIADLEAGRKVRL